MGWACLEGQVQWQEGNVSADHSLYRYSAKLEVESKPLIGAQARPERPNPLWHKPPEAFRHHPHTGTSGRVSLMSLVSLNRP
jgi:hypothetical protein